MQTRGWGISALFGLMGAFQSLAFLSCSDSVRLPPGAGGSAGVGAGGRAGSASGGRAVNAGSGGIPSGAGRGGSTSNGGSSNPDPECAAGTGTATLQLTPIVTEGLTRPTFITAAPGDDTRLFVLEQAGTIRVVADGVLLTEPFLDLSDVVNDAGDEQGLLGLAFHPGYASNGRFFVHYSSDPVAAGIGDNAGVTSEFTAASADRADRASERRLVMADQTNSNHNGGMLGFSPSDGMLYIARGNGGGADSQDLGTLLGKILRIDVEREEGGRPYAIPAGNMSGAGTQPEIWSYGLRNPWRFSFDACTSDLYIADVGEQEIEEINHEPVNVGGRNYGWAVLEGTRCYGGDGECDATGMTPPVVEYTHDVEPGESGNCSVTGGYVYRGRNIPALRGAYLYADYCSGRFWSVRVEGGQVSGEQDITDDVNPGGPEGRLTSITSFGADNAGELYVLTQSGDVYRIDAE